MRRRVAVVLSLLACMALIAAFALWYLNIWHPDQRISDTAFATAVLAFVLGVAAGCVWIAEEDL